MSRTFLKPIDLKDIGLHSNMLQSSFWGCLKSSFGWRAFAFKIEDSESLLVLLRELGAGQSLAYVPHGPMISSDWDAVTEIAESLRSYLPKSCMFVRFDPPWGVKVPALSKDSAGYPESELAPPASGGASSGPYGPYFKANMDIQPPSTVILDLRKPEDELLAGMKSKTRYNIRLSAKKGVEVRTTGIEGLPKWYDLYKITAERDKIALHGYDYYEKIFDLASEQAAEGAPELRLLQAVIDDVVEAGIITAWQGRPFEDRRATYLYGASSNNKRSYMPAYALQWEAIKQAAVAGCTIYDFFGIPPADNPEHPMHGLYRFKTGFGGEILHRPGCWDFPYKKSAYKAFRTLELARNYYYKNLKKR